MASQKCSVGERNNFSPGRMNLVGVSELRRRFIGLDQLKAGIMVSTGFVWSGYLIGGPLWPALAISFIIVATILVTLVAFSDRKSTLAYHLAATARGFMFLAAFVLCQASFPFPEASNRVWFFTAVALFGPVAILRLYYDMAKWNKTLLDWESRKKINLEAGILRVTDPWFESSHKNLKVVYRAAPFMLAVLFVSSHLLKSMFPGFNRVLALHVFPIAIIPLAMPMFTLPIAWSIKLRQTEKATGKHFMTEFADVPIKSGSSGADKVVAGRRRETPEQAKHVGRHR